MTPASTLQHEVILASAGSGKTWQLATRYLRLVAGGADPASILASTFTRAAAAEIRDRIIGRAVDALDDEDKRRDLSEAIGLPLDGRAAAALVQRLVERWHRLQIRTLDSLLGGVVSCFPLELGLPPSLSIADEMVDAALRREATGRMLRSRDGARLVSLLRQLTAGSSDRGVAGAIDRAVGELYEVWREAPSAAWERIAPAPVAAPDDAVACAQRLRTAMRLAAPRRAHDPRLEKAVEGAAGALERGDWEEFVGKGIGAKAAQGETTYYKKPIPDEVVAALHDLVAQAVAVVREGVRRQTAGARDMIAAWQEQYQALKHERGVVTFGDLPWLVAGAEGRGTLSEIGYRLDARLHHLLLDEMQDTSIPQWLALRPFAEEIFHQLPGDRSFFAVGDLKQSIYGWRAAAPEVLESLANEPSIESRTLERTRRCRRAVVEAVNAVFLRLDANPALARHEAAARHFGSFFRAHETAAPGAGYARLEVASAAAEGESASDRTLDDAAYLAAALHRRQPEARIGVLVRRNESVSRVLCELGPGALDVPAAGRGGTPLVDAPPVEAVLSLLHLSEHPGDTVAAFHVVHSPLGAAIGLVPSTGAVPAAAACDRVARVVRREILEHGLAATVRGWVERIAGSCDPRQVRRLVGLLDLAIEHESLGGGTDAFIETVRTSRVPDEAAAPVQVMTVHQSKGLEFDLVVLTDLDSALVRSGGGPAGYRRPGDGSPADTVFRWIRRARAELVPEVAEVLAEHTARQAVEALCLLYVAMTRARHGLYMVVAPPHRGQQTSSAAAMLRSALGGGPHEAESVMGEIGNEEAMVKELASALAAEPSEPLPSTEPRPGRVRLRASTGPPRLAVPPPSAPKAPGSLVDALRASRPEAIEARACGTAMHAMLELVEWIDEGEPDDAALLAALRAVAPRRSHEWFQEQVGAFRRAVACEPIRALLRRDGDADRTVHREFRYARLTSDGLQTGIVDRLTLHRRGDGVERIRIVDFKTDAVGAEGVAALAERYAPQLRAYRDAVVEEFRVPAESVETLLAFVGAGVVTSV